MPKNNNELNRNDALENLQMGGSARAKLKSDTVSLAIQVEARLDQ